MSENKKYGPPKGEGMEPYPDEFKTSPLHFPNFEEPSGQPNIFCILDYPENIFGVKQRIPVQWDPIHQEWYYSDCSHIMLESWFKKYPHLFVFTNSIFPPTKVSTPSKDLLKEGEASIPEEIKGAKQKSVNIQFGDYVYIEQKRYGVPNEMWVYKVVATLRSNAYVPVPVQAPGKEELHEAADVALCLCDLPGYTTLLKFRVEDILKINHLAAPRLPLNRFSFKDCENYREKCIGHGRECIEYECGHPPELQEQIDHLKSEIMGYKKGSKFMNEEKAVLQSQLSSITAQRDEAVKISDEYRLVIKAVDESRSNVMTERDAALKEVVETRAALDKVMDTLKRQRTNNPDTEYAGWNAGVAIQNKYKKEEQK